MRKRIFLILALLLLVGLFLGITGAFPEIQNYKTRKEVFAYVTKNQDTIEIKDRTKRQQFPYAEWGFGDAGVMYGYIYDPNPNYETVGQKYHGGYRIDGATTYGNGWFYYQKICENWYYYENTTVDWTQQLPSMPFWGLMEAVPFLKGSCLYSFRSIADRLFDYCSFGYCKMKKRMVQYCL